MKASILAFTAITGATLAAAQPHAHKHAHLHEQLKRTATETAWVSGPTAYAFVLDGKTLSKEEVCSGVANNQMKWADKAPEGLCDSSSSSAAASSTSANNGGAFYGKEWSSAASSTTKTTTSAVKTSTSASSAAAATSSSTSSAGSGGSGWNNWSGGQGVDSDFPDGQLDCTSFPSSYGAVPVSYLNMNGWTGLQAVTFGANAITDIVTGLSGDSCREGMMCSYACPPGYQKSQWPTTQGATGQSVGGIQCKNGKLFLTNKGLSSKLCIPGKGGVQAQNKAGGVVAICRTDYPGTESETVPVELQSGQTKELCNPDAATYYTWKGGATSAQYYLNPIGVGADKGCQWSSAGTNVGNWAPINFGVGYKDGKTWLSIFQNAPTTYEKYQGTVEIVGDGLSANCKYSNGQYCQGGSCNDKGCTGSFPPLLFPLSPFLLLPSRISS